jgi:excisionase family DNA binding protein
MPKDLVTVRKAASLLDVAASAVYRWIAARKIVAYRVGGRWRLSEKDVKAFPLRNDEGFVAGPAEGARHVTHAEAAARLRGLGYRI